MMQMMHQMQQNNQQQMLQMQMMMMQMIRGTGNPFNNPSPVSGTTSSSNGSTRQEGSMFSPPSELTELK